MAAAAILKKSQKLRFSQLRFDLSLRNLIMLMQNGRLNLADRLRILNFTNPRWRTAAILKTVKLPYLCNRFTDFDEIWHGDAHCPLQWTDR